MKIEVATIYQKVVIPASPEEVYEAFVDPKVHTAFTGSKATGKAKIGGKFTTWDGYIFGKFLAFEPGKCLTQELKTTDWIEGYPPSTFELVFKAVPEGTEVSMTHANVPKEQEKDLAEGWEEFYWVPLKKYFKKKAKPKV